MRTKFRSNEPYPLHVTGKMDSAFWKNEDLPLVWEVLSEAIDELQDEYQLTSHAFVLMSNHYHWICTYAIEKDPPFFEFFEEIVNIRLLGLYREYKVLNTRPEVIKVKNFTYYQSLYRYVYRNPVTAGLCQKAHQYPYSTLPYILGKKGLAFNVKDNMNLCADPFRTLNYINSE